MKRLALALLLSLLGLALAGCASSGGRHSSSPSVMSVSQPARVVVRSPRVIAATQQNMAGVSLHNGAHFISSTRLAIETWGSGSCPAIPNKLVVLAPDTIRIHLIAGIWRPAGSYGRIIGRSRALPGMRLVPKRPEGGCTLDLRTTPMVIAINPKQINVHHRLTIRFYYYRSKKPDIRYAPPL